MEEPWSSLLHLLRPYSFRLLLKVGFGSRPPATLPAVSNYPTDDTQEPERDYNASGCGETARWTASVAWRRRSREAEHAAVAQGRFGQPAAVHDVDELPRRKTYRDHVRRTAIRWGYPSRPSAVSLKLKHQAAGVAV